jgi:hypothetical protein
MTSMSERRRNPRFTAWLPLRVAAISGKLEPAAMTLLTRNISRRGICFSAPYGIEAGQFIEIEVTLPGAGPGGKDLHVSSEVFVLRIEPGNKPGWYVFAAALGEPTAGYELGWHRLVAEFERRPASEQEI